MRLCGENISLEVLTLLIIITFFLTGIPTGEVVSDEDIKVIARDHMVGYDILSTYLELSQQQRSAFSKMDWAERKHECLKMWKEMKGNEATYGALITAAEKAQDQKLADAVRAICDGMCMYTGRDDPMV